MIINTDMGRMKVAHGFNIYIDVTTACNSRCPFCIAPVIGRHNGPGFFDGVDFALSLAEKCGGTIQIVGGEPTISKRLYPLFEKIGQYSITRTVVNTNGTGVNDTFANCAFESGIRFVNISRHHYDEVRNQSIMLQKPFLGNKELERKLSYLYGAGISMRLNCNLISGEIDSVQEMQKFMDWGKSIGCYTFSFSQLFPLGLFDYQVPPILGYTENRQVDLSKIVDELDERYTGSHGPYNSCSWGSSWGRSGQPDDDGIIAHRRFWEGRDGEEFSLKTLAGYYDNGKPRETVYEKNQDAELRSDILAIAVVQSDGLVTASWDRRERVLFVPQTVSNYNAIPVALPSYGFTLST